MVISTIVNFSCSIALVLVCGVPRNFVFAVVVDHCPEAPKFQGVLFLAVSVNLLTDLVFLVLPLPMLWESAMETRQKVSVYTFLGLAFS
jgi:hypothetical protein